MYSLRRVKHLISSIYNRLLGLLGLNDKKLIVSNNWICLYTLYYYINMFHVIIVTSICDQIYNRQKTVSSGLHVFSV